MSTTLLAELGSCILEFADVVEQIGGKTIDGESALAGFGVHDPVLLPDVFLNGNFYGKKSNNNLLRKERVSILL